MRLDCAQMENDFLRKRLQQCEERLDSEMKARTELEHKVREGEEGSGSPNHRERVSSLLRCERPLCCLVLGKEELYCWNKSCPCWMGGGYSEGWVVAQLPSVQTRVRGLALAEITRIWFLGSDCKVITAHSNTTVSVFYGCEERPQPRQLL